MFQNEEKLRKAVSLSDQSHRFSKILIVSDVAFYTKKGCHILAQPKLWKNASARDTVESRLPFLFPASFVNLFAVAFLAISVVTIHPKKTLQSKCFFGGHDHDTIQDSLVASSIVIFRHNLVPLGPHDGFPQ